MTDIASDSSDGISFDERTTNDTFQERLRQAQLSTDDNLPNEDFTTDLFFDSDDAEALRRQVKRLELQVMIAENRVKDMETKLAACKQRRQNESGLTNMTPEERAAYAEEEEKRINKAKEKRERARRRKEAKVLKKDASTDEESENEEQDTSEESEIEKDNTPDWDVVFEYLLLLESTLDEEATNTLSGSDFLPPNLGLREKALNHEEVKRQVAYSSIEISKAKNVLESNLTEKDGNIRHCELSGTSYDQTFNIIFDVMEPQMIVNNLEFEVDIDMQIAIGNILEQIKEDCNIMAFFRLLVHYATLDKQRKSVFDQLIQKYKDTSVNIEMLSRDKLKFESTTGNDIYLTFLWKMIPDALEKETLDANIENHIQPMLRLDAKMRNKKDESGLLKKVNDGFMFLVEQQGVYRAVESIVNKMFF
ncbi:uncharacterized protein BX663DRAFT_507312 [Cokeromyces recurvatus]|uniref:uncharacterized protein n=1 Tax=Cokeromyces recurvatus TaxID=90255 RepID=UPI00222012C5|nr:uncharacterized protein BX663DRAFT_507312 [Cokeromyces recurvatus]KAI7903692.1 hypothetical protein BX663DRAFT_507312 [Cokeromyces recurvatus]